LGFSPQATGDAENFNFTTLSLQSLSESDFTVLSHPNFPRHSVRIKRTKKDWCDKTVASYTGYIDTTEARHIFFYFFESRNNPDTDDVIFWTNGGPGCTSSLGLFMELGPCRVVDANTTKYHPQSWNDNANIFFIDQPIGVGYSYADYGEYVSTTEEAAQDIASFVAIFFETFKKFQGRAFHMAGESYAGQYVPIYAAAVHDQNNELIKAGVQPVNLKSVMIGNGLTNTELMVASYFDAQCTSASVSPIQAIDRCVRMKTALPRCAKLFKESCVDGFDAIGCSAASQFCGTEIESPFHELGLNPYDVTKKCSGDELAATLCYPVINTIKEYINSPAVREDLGVSKALINQNITTCNNDLNGRFAQSLDMFRVQTSFFLESLLERGVKVLIYVGALDWICNWVGNRRMSEALDWRGAESFRKQELKPWSRIKGEEVEKPAGQFKSSGDLTFLTIYGAGHMVPYDKPDEALAMLKRWLADEEF